MQIATLVNAHKNPQVVKVTLDSVRRYVTDKIVLIIDEKGWKQFEDFSYPGVKKICGYPHDHRYSPYKNVALGMNALYEYFPDVDWYNYIEYDVLYLNDHFKLDLQRKTFFAVLGFNHRFLRSWNCWLAQQILDNSYLKAHRLLGAVLFYSQNSMKWLIHHNFFNKLLARTRDFRGSKIPHFRTCCVEEVIFPSAASMFGRVGELSNHNKYMMATGRGTIVDGRYNVTGQSRILDPKNITSETSIIHPSKSMGCFIRRALHNNQDPFGKQTIKLLS